jgi:hypothetical protein
MSYVVDPTNSNQPTEDKMLETAAAELRALKRYIRENLLEGITESQAELLALTQQVQLAYNRAEALVAYEGLWTAQSGAAAPPMSVTHAGKLWFLLTPVSDIALAVPGVSPAWQEVATNSTQIIHAATTVALELTRLQTVLDAHEFHGVHGEHVNKALNSLFLVVRRGTAFPGLTNTVTPVCDCWQANIIAGTAVATVDRAGLGPNPRYPFSLRATITTPKAVLAAAEFGAIGTFIEGYHLMDLLDRPVALGFFARAAVIGTYYVALRNSPATHSYVVPIQITAPNTFQQFAIQLPDGLPSAVPWNLTNGIGLGISFCFGAGASYRAPTNNVWHATNYVAGADQVSIFNAAGQDFLVAGLQILQNDQPLLYPFRSVQEEQRMVERYVRQSPAAVGHATSTTRVSGAMMTYNPPMRVAPVASMLSLASAVLDPGVAQRNITGLVGSTQEASGGWVDVDVSATTNNKPHHILAGRLLLDAQPLL